MILKQYLKSNVNGVVLGNEIKESNSVEGFTGMQYKNGIIYVHGLSIIDESKLDEVISTHNHLISDVPRILKYQIDKNQDFRTVNHNTDIDVSLDVEEVFGLESSNRGLLIGKKYKMEDELIFEIEYNYQYGVIRQVTHQQVILKWYNENGEVNSLIKDKGFKRLSRKQERDVVFKRRTSIIFLLEVEIINLLSAGATTNQEAEQMIELGASLMEDISIEIGKFKNSGHPQPIIDKLTALQTNYPFLSNEIAPGITVINYVANFLTY